MHVRNGIAPRPILLERPKADKGTLDAIADLKDWITDADTGRMTDAAESAWVAVRLALQEGREECAKGAFQQVVMLKERNGYTHGQDIPENHLHTYGQEFRSVLETLQDKLMDIIQVQAVAER